MEAEAGLRRAPSDAEARFADIYKLYSKLVHAYCARRTGHSQAADAVAGGPFLVAWKKIEQVPPGDAALPLALYAVAYRVLSHQWRSAARSRRLLARLNGVAQIEPPSPDLVLLRNEEHRGIFKDRVTSPTRRSRDSAPYVVGTSPTRRSRQSPWAGTGRGEAAGVSGPAEPLRRIQEGDRRSEHFFEGRCKVITEDRVIALFFSAIRSPPSISSIRSGRSTSPRSTANPKGWTIEPRSTASHRGVWSEGRA